MTQVRLRHQDDARAHPIAEAPFDKLGGVIPTLKSWGIADYEDRGLSGQFVYDELCAYFEVIIHEDDE